jgi:hypothetical protein
MENLYENSWALYKLESEGFDDDFGYYKQFCNNKDTLELFAGYGRLSNYLKNYTSRLECVELEKHFSNHINLPTQLVHTLDVLQFKPKRKYERIIAGYNSFALIVEDDKIKQFFKNLADWLQPGGMVSLSYYDYRHWQISPQKILSTTNATYHYVSRFEPLNLKTKSAVWIDIYTDNETKKSIQFKYPVRVYKNQTEIKNYLAGSDIKLIKTIENYSIKNIKDAGWIEYVFKKEY